MSKYVGRIITDQAPAGYSVAFDGTGDYLTVANNTAFDFGSGNFTIEFWVYRTAAGDFMPVEKTINGQYGSWYIEFTTATGQITWNCSSTGSSNDMFNAVVFGTLPSLNTWYHVAVVRNGSTFTGYINGVGTSIGTSSATIFNSSYGITIGAHNGSASFYLNGYLSNVRILKGTALYTAAFTPPTQLLNVTNTSLLTCNSPAIVDQSSNAFAITTNGNSAVSTFTPFTAYVPYNPALGASTPGVWTLDEAMQAAATRQWNMYDPYFQNTTLLLHGNGTNAAQNNTFLDSSTNNFTITRNGNTTQGSFSPFSQTGWSNYFDGTGDFLTAVGANLALGTGDFTIEFWFYAAAYSSSVDTSAMFDSRSGNNTTGFLIGPVFNNTNTLNVVQNTSPILTANTTYPLNIWVHCAVVRSSGTITLYQNGVSVGSVANTTNNTATTNYIASGYWQPSGSGQMFNGYLSNLRISNTARYTANFTPSASVFVSDSNTRLLACQSNRFLDSSSNAYPITPYGTPSVQAFSPFYPTAAYASGTIGGSGYFDGTGDYLSVTNTDTFGTGSFTVQAWIYFTSIESNDSAFIDGRPTGGSSTGWLMNVRSSNKVLRFASASAYDGVTALNANSWNHVAATYTSGTLRLYVNGNIDATFNSLSFNFSDTNFVIGKAHYSDGDWNGYISSLQLIKGTALYTGSTYTIPTAPPTNDSGTALLTNFTNAGIVDSTAKNVLETVGNAQISTTQSKFGGSSMYFDGNGDALFGVYSPNLNLGSGDFTIEGWFYFSALPSNNYVVFASYGNSITAQRWLLYYDTRTSQSSPGLRFSVINASNSLIVDVVGAGTSGWATGTWYHVAITRSGNSWKMFRDGTQNGSTVTDTDAIPDVTANGLVIAAEPDKSTAAFNGYIDDLRITRGIARYTANFTPQTSQWQDQ